MLTRREWLAASALGALTVRTGFRAGLSVEAGARDRALRGGRRDRHPGTPGRDAHRSGAQAERRGRQPRRRREPGRHPGDRDRAARRLHHRHDRLAPSPSIRACSPASCPMTRVKDFAPISLVATAPLVFVVHPSVPANSCAGAGRARKAEAGHDLCAARARHADASRGRTAAPGDRHRFHSVPYRGAGPSIADFIAGQVQMTFATVPSILEHVRAGRARALGDGRRSLAAPAERADHERGRPQWRRRRADVRPGGAGRDPAAHHRQIERGRHGLGDHRSVARAADGPRLHAGRQQAGGSCGRGSTPISPNGPGSSKPATSSRTDFFCPDVEIRRAGRHCGAGARCPAP